MIKKSITLILFCCSIVLQASAQSSEKKETPPPLFTLAKKPVPADEFIYLYRKNHTDKQGDFTQAKVEEYLDLFVNFKLKVEEARRRGLDTTQAFLKEYSTYREELRKPYLPDTRMLDSLAELTYKRMQEEVRASHILLNLKPDATPEDTLAVYKKALELRNRALTGESFEALANTFSEDPSAKINRGDLGYFTAMQMVYPFEQAAYTTSPGSISMPVRTRFGYHLVKITDRKPARGEVEVSHIMIRTGEGFDNEKSKNTIFEIYEQLQKGVKWEELVKEYSQDPSSKENGGKLRPFGVGAMAAVPEFEQTAFALKKPGDISDPFQTQFGWHIMRLESKIPMPAYQEMAASLKNRVSRDERSQISKQALQTKVKRKFGFTENQQVRSKVLALADSTLQKGKWKAKPTVAPTEVLFTAQGQQHTAKDFIQFAERMQKPNSMSPAQYLETLYNQYVDEALGLLMEEKIKAQNPDYNWLLKEYYEGILLFEIMEKEVWNKASEDSVGQRRYFEQHAASYQAKERVKARIFSSASSKVMLDVLKEMVEEGDSAKVQAFVKEQNIRQETGAFEKTDRPVLGKITWAKGAHLAENNGTHYLVWVRDMIAPGPRSFNDARAAVISDYQNYLEKQWLEQLRKKYPVKISKKGKQFILQQLVKN